MEEPLLRLNNVAMEYAGFGNGDPLLGDINLEIHRGKSLGLVGQSGAGKSTLARLILGTEAPSGGEILFKGKSVSFYGRELKRKIQIIWQDSSLYLNPYFTVLKLLAEPMEVFGMGGKSWRKSKACELLDLVNLPHSALFKKPHELSGGECQRVAIARAVTLNPELIICDEPFTGLDIPNQLQMMKLLARFHKKFGTTYLLISHDLSVVKGLCPHMAVIKEGRIVEQGETDAILNSPSNPHTKKLVGATLRLPRHSLMEMDFKSLEN